MKFVIKHEIKGRIRAHAVQYRMTFEQADRMQYYLESQDMITSAKVQNRTGDFTICYKGDREKVIKLLQTFLMRKLTFRKIMHRIPDAN